MQFYVYIYLEPGGDPFYVGKGRDYRAKAHLKPQAANPLLRDRIESLRMAGLQPEIQMIYCASEADAFNMERLMITVIGRVDRGSGPLLNRTAGGQGTSGRHWFRHSETTKAKIRTKMIGREISSETRARMSASGKGRPGPTPEHMAKMQAGMRTPEGRKAMRRDVSPEQLAAMTARAAELTRGSKKTPETRRRMSEAQRKRRGS